MPTVFRCLSRFSPTRGPLLTGVLAASLLAGPVSLSQAEPADSDTPAPAVTPESAATPAADTPSAAALDRTTATEATPEAASPRRVAVFVRNRAGEMYDEKLPVLEDLLVANLSGLDFQLVSREDTLRTLESWQSAPSDSELTTDQLLDRGNSALRLAQLMKADLLLVATLTSVSQEESRVRRPDLNVDRSFQVDKLLVTWRLLDTAAGASFQAGTAEARQQAQQSATRQAITPTLDTLLAQAATQIAAQFEARGGAAALPAVARQAGEISFQVICSTQDLQVPEVLRLEDGSLTVGGQPLQLEALQVPVELSGVVIGSSSQPLTAAAGLHTLRLARDGFEPWERTVNLREGLVLQVPLSFSKEGLERWKEMTGFLEDLKRGERLSEAQAERIQGFAQMLRQSGVRVDRRSDIKVDTHQAPAIHQHHTTVDQQNVTAPASVWP